MYRFSWFDKNKKTSINLIDKKDNKSFQYAVAIALNHKEIKQDPQKITKFKAFTNIYNWEEINFPSEKDNWKNFKINNLKIVLNVLYAKKEKIYPVYIS